MMIAVVLSSNIRRMVKDNVLVRKPVGIESAGSMNILFTDKTGTLTEGKMSLEKIILADGGVFTGAMELARRAPRLQKLFVASCRENTSAELSGKTAVGGNGTERALLNATGGLAYLSEYRITARLPFDSALKYSAVRLTEGGNETVLVKGAPERLLPYAKKYYGADGAQRVMSPSVRALLGDSIARLGLEGKRVLLLATSDKMPSKGNMSELSIICAVSLGDPVRASAKRSVSELLGAGIGVVMITGDGKATAEFIAKECGIIGGRRRLIMDGEELSRLNDAQLERVLPELAVVARALPTDKSRLVRVAQGAGLVVGMTGDGVNDAPALKTADVGFAMGCGTDVAKDAGDIIILDNDLASIVKAVLYGRTIFKSIRKFITLQLTMNFCAVGVSMICPFVGIDAPVTVVQMLWINIIMDTLGGLAFAGEAPSALYMREAPKRRDEPILNRYMINQIVMLGGFTVSLCLFFLLSPSVTGHFRYSHDNIYLLTAFFALFIFTSVLNCFGARCDRLGFINGISKNPAFISIMTLVCVVQIVFVYLGGSVLRTAPLTLSELSYTLSLSLTVVPAELLRRVIWRLRGNKTGF